MDARKNIKLFVYGSLMKGFFNHHYLKNALFLKVDRAKPLYSLYNLGEYPGLLNEGDMAVEGEVYLIDEATLRWVDTLEDYPRMYTREDIELESGEHALTYFIKKTSDEFKKGVKIYKSWKDYAKENNMR